MKKLFFYASLVCVSLMWSCSKELMVSEDEKPEWLGESIYKELSKADGTKLTGTFNTYLRLIDDLGYSGVLNATGSKTIFPANDDAFNAFFASDNEFGVHSYEELTESQKNQLLYSSMFDNAILTSMLSNISQGDNNVTQGMALKHQSNLSPTYMLETYLNGGVMPKNNPYWKDFATTGINVVSDGNSPMVMHLTREQMLNNYITITGTDCDYSILRGDPIGTERAADNLDVDVFIFKSKVINGDVTCQNGYIHQVDKVIVPPGNIAQVLRNNANTKLFSRIVDYFSIPVFDSEAQQITNNYNNWARNKGLPTLDKIYRVRYFNNSPKNSLTKDENGYNPNCGLLSWDLGENSYCPQGEELVDAGAIFAPTDEAIKKFFCSGGEGAYIMDIYGSDKPNTEENIEENLDSLFNRNPAILRSFVNNFIQSSLIATVPSKFNEIRQASSGEFMYMSLDSIARVVENGNQKYDVVMANNGVVYKLKSMIVPDEYNSVYGPVALYVNNPKNDPNIKTLAIMKWFADDKTTGATPSKFGVDLYYYLMSMKSNFVFFCPNDEALQDASASACVIDPVSLKKDATPRALQFYLHDDYIAGQKVPTRFYGVKIHRFNKDTGVIDPTEMDKEPNLAENYAKFKSQVADFLNYNTLVLNPGEEFGKNHYYLTKHGGAIKLDDYKVTEVGGVTKYEGTVRGGAQIDNNLPAAKIEVGYKESNGWTFSIDNVIQPSITSIHYFMSHNTQFKKFMEICDILENQTVLDFADLSLSRYRVFDDATSLKDQRVVNFFNGYNYTFFAPNDDAIIDAQTTGNLPSVDKTKDIVSQYNGNEGLYTPEEIQKAKDAVRARLNAFRAFVRYHFMNNSVFADNSIKEKKYQSMYSTELGIPANIWIKSENGVLSVVDANSLDSSSEPNWSKAHKIDASASDKLVNKMARDYIFDKDAISVSSFASVHEISTPLYYANKFYAGDDFDN